MSSLGVISRGVKLPIIKSGDSKLKQIIIESLIDAQYESRQPFKDKDIICITESIVARSESNYVTVDDIAQDISSLYGENAEIIVLWPIYSRNRFSMILKGIARSASKIYLVLDNEKDEVGNDKTNPFTNIDIEQFYRDTVENEQCDCILLDTDHIDDALKPCSNILVARCHVRQEEIAKVILRHAEVNESKDMVKLFELKDVCSCPNDEHGYNSEFGLLGSNKATEESLKLFPRRQTCMKLCEEIKSYFKEQHNVDLEVMVYGDGCFKDPVGNIWEFADPVVSPYYTKGLEGTPNEVKIKYVADNESSDDIFVKERIRSKEKDLRGQMLSQGTTPRRYCDLVGSLADLTSGSGDKGTPVIWISNYFNNFADD